MTWRLTGQRAGHPRRGSLLGNGTPRVADAGPDRFGVHDPQAAARYLPRPVDDELEDALGAHRPLLVVTGDRLAGASRSLHRAVRRMLGDRLLLPVTEPHTADLAAAVRIAQATARREGPVVVVADDAPPALLDQVDVPLVGRLSADVRLVLTTRRTFLDGFLAPRTRALLDDALVEIPNARDGRPLGEHVRPTSRARAVLEPPEGVPLALLRAAVDWERLGIPHPLTGRVLTEIAAVHLDALGVPTAERGGLRRAVRELVRADHGGLRLLRETRRAGSVHLAPDRLFSRLADGADGDNGGGWAVPEELARDLWHRLGPEERARAARVALARGDDQVALWLATQVSPDDLEPEALYRLGVTLAQRSAAHTPDPGRWDRGAMNWLVAALDRTDDPDLVRRAQQAILLIESRRDAPDQVPSARTPADDEAPRLIYLRPREPSGA